MINDETVKQLQAISMPVTFAQNEYITTEGMPGNDMYIVLKGSVGVYVTSVLGTFTEVSRIAAGDFFGEMAIFDNLPRSASCIALEDTICVSISKANLTQFFSKCPDVASKILENMSGRIRRLNNELYKSERFVQNLHAPKFVLPDAYSFSHIVEEPRHDLDYTTPITEACPICGKEITVLSLRRNVLRERKIDPDRRAHYVECDPLWFDVQSCPYCHYSNHYLSFFNMIPFKREVIKRVLKEQHDPVYLKTTFLKTPFDHLVVKYLQAIHINEVVNYSDSLLIGKLWTNLYWLACDSYDDGFTVFCAKQAAEKLKKAISDRRVTGDEQCSLSLTLAHMIAAIKGDAAEIGKYCDLAMESTNSDTKINAIKLREKCGK